MHPWINTFFGQLTKANMITVPKLGESLTISEHAFEGKITLDELANTPSFILEEPHPYASEQNETNPPPKYHIVVNTSHKSLPQDHPVPNKKLAKYKKQTTITPTPKASILSNIMGINPKRPQPYIDRDANEKYHLEYYNKSDYVGNQAGNLEHVFHFIKQNGDELLEVESTLCSSLPLEEFSDLILNICNFPLTIKNSDILNLFNSSQYIEHISELSVTSYSSLEGVYDEFEREQIKCITMHDFYTYTSLGKVEYIESEEYITPKARMNVRKLENPNKLILQLTLHDSANTLQQIHNVKFDHDEFIPLALPIQESRINYSWSMHPTKKTIEFIPHEKQSILYGVLIPQTN